jgi:hypothetical protein
MRDAAVDLYWLPLGAGGRSVRLNGLAFEFVAARFQHRTRCDLYHSALEVRVAHERYVVEMAPVWNDPADERGVVAEGPVGSRRLAGCALFRYEIRRWHNGRIPDIAEAVESPQRLSEDPAAGRRVLELAAAVPTPVWGRDELHTGEMWNSNSVTAWLLARAGIDVRETRPPSADAHPAGPPALWKLDVSGRPRATSRPRRADHS